ncbi:hypothetical protein FRAHR75_60106 [Frankia sp. Hr75.2]|nr:hypothetical protein FRAHR75_60106 [Frankia sp. Hr75.2]
MRCPCCWPGCDRPGRTPSRTPSWCGRRGAGRAGLGAPWSDTSHNRTVWSPEPVDTAARTTGQLLADLRAVTGTALPLGQPSPVPGSRPG